MLPILRRAFLSLAVAAAVAFLGAIPVASAAGFYHGEDLQRGDASMTVMASGAVLFFLTLAVMGPLTRLGGSVVTGLARSETRPAPAIALGLIVCGTLCVISSLWLAWSAHANSGPQGMASAMQQMRSQLPNGASIHFEIPNFGRGADPSGGPMILTTLAFLLGCSLIGVGVWSSLGPHDAGAGYAFGSNHRGIKSPIPAADEARL